MISERGGRLRCDVDDLRGGLVGPLDGTRDVMAALDRVRARLGQPCVDVLTLAGEQEPVGGGRQQGVGEDESVAVGL